MGHKKIIVLVGPTASGKSDVAIALAKKYDGEVISADSRQVYRGMDRGTGKVTRDPVSCHSEPVEGSALHLEDSSARSPTRSDSCYFSEGVRHHLLDVASPKKSYNVTHFVRDAKKAIADIRKRGKLPIVCGGTGFWVQALITGECFPPVRPNPALRRTFKKLSADELFTVLEEKDPERAATIDRYNKVRLIRALEIVEALGKVPIPSTNHSLLTTNYLIIALNPDKETLQKNIETRLKKRLKQGMIEEVARLRTDGVSWKRLKSFGLEYKNVALFLQEKITRDQMKANVLKESMQYAKRQLTFLRRLEKLGMKIHWVTTPKEAEGFVKNQRLAP